MVISWGQRCERVGPARVRRLPARMKLNKFKYLFHVLYMYLSSKHAEMYSNTLLLPLYWRKMPVFDTSLKISPRDGCHCCSDMLFGTPKYNCWNYFCPPMVISSFHHFWRVKNLRHSIPNIISWPEIVLYQQSHNYIQITTSCACMWEN
jgi:hypothetical protein